MCRYDDEIYRHFREEFPDFHVENVDYDAMKTPEVLLIPFATSHQEYLKPWNLNFPHASSILSTLFRTRRSGETFAISTRIR